MTTARQWIPVRTHRFSPHPEVHPVELYQHDNGLRIVIHEDHRAPVFAFHTWFAVGSRHEVSGRTGMAHLFEHLMFKETKNMPEGEFDRLMERAGAQTNAATWLDWTFYYERLGARHLELPFRLESDRMENMTLGEQQLEAEREVVLNERRMRVDNDPDGLLYERLYARAYGEAHPYGWPTIGWERDIRAIRLEDCLEFYRTYYAPNNAVLVVSGDVDTRRVLELVDARYGHMEPQEIPEAAWPPGPRQGVHSEEHVLDIVSDRLVLAFPSPALTDSAFASYEVLCEVLFNSDSARLTRSLVLDRELASSASAWLGGFRYPGLFHVDCQATPGVSAEAILEVVMAELERVAAHGIAESELAKARTKLEADTVQELLSAGSIAHGLGMWECTTGRFEGFFEVASQIADVTRADVQAAAQQMLASGTRILCVGRPSGELPEDDDGELDGDFDDGESDEDEHGEVKP